MPKNVRTEDFKLENMRLSYPFLLKLKKREDNGVVKFNYEAVLLYPKGGPLMGLTETKTPLDVAAECQKIAVEHWGDKAVGMIQNGIIKNPFKDGDTKDGMNQKTGEQNPGYAGHKFIRVSSSQERQPECYGAQFGADGKPVRLTDPDALYPGCYVHAVVNAFTWENNLGGKGISFGVSMVQFAKDGAKIGKGGAPNPNSFFESATVPAGPEAKPEGSASGLFA